jgi:hypothetical protein
VSDLLTHGDEESYTEWDTEPHSNSNEESYAEWNTEPHSNSNEESYAEWNTEPHSNSNEDPYSESNRKPHSNGYSEPPPSPTESHTPTAAESLSAKLCISGSRQQTIHHVRSDIVVKSVLLD